MECLTLIDSKMARGTYYSGGYQMLDILRRKQKNLNERFVAEGKIASVDKGEELVAAAPAKEDEVLSRVMYKVINQHTINIIAMRIVDENDREEQVALDVVEEFSWCDVEENLDHDSSWCVSFVPTFVSDACSLLCLCFPTALPGCPPTRLVVPVTQVELRKLSKLE